MSTENPLGGRVSAFYANPLTRTCVGKRSIVPVWAIVVCVAGGCLDFSSYESFDDLSGPLAKERLAHVWPPAVDAEAVESVSYRSTSEKDSYSTWYRIKLRRSDALAWSDDGHLDEEDWARYLAVLYATRNVQAIHRTVPGPPPLHTTTGAMPAWWSPPSIECRATEVMSRPTARATYSVYDDSNTTLWIYQFAYPESLWDDDNMPDGQVIDLTAEHRELTYSEFVEAVPKARFDPKGGSDISFRSTSNRDGYDMWLTMTVESHDYRQLLNEVTQELLDLARAAHMDTPIGGIDKETSASAEFPDDWPEPDPAAPLWWDSPSDAPVECTRWQLGCESSTRGWYWAYHREQQKLWIWEWYRRRQVQPLTDGSEAYNLRPTWRGRKAESPLGGSNSWDFGYTELLSNRFSCWEAR